jgi:hypothetical protein
MAKATRKKSVSGPKRDGKAVAKTGGCYCGENRYELVAAAVDTHHCHCSICRRLQGAAFVTLSIFPRAAFRWTKGGKLDTYHSSPKVHRHRCKTCGAPLTVTFEGHESFAPMIAIMRAGLDADSKPEHPPTTLRHAFWPDRVGWLTIKDQVRRTKGFA